MPITLIPEDSTLEVSLMGSLFIYRPLLDEEIQNITMKHTLRGMVNLSGRREALLQASLTGWELIYDQDGNPVKYSPDLVRLIPSAIREALENILFTGLIFKNHEDEEKN